MKSYGNTLAEVRTKLNISGYRLAAEFEVPGQFGVALLQHRNGKRYAVAYGLQYETGIGYGQAAREYGLCVMHSLCCAGKLDCEE